MPVEGRCSPSLFAMKTLGHEVFEPDAKTAWKGASHECCVCGVPGDVAGAPWNRARTLSDSFGPIDSFASPASPVVCGACVFFAVARTFQASVQERQLPIKMWPQASWRSYSHIFTAAGHEIGTKQAWRRFLLAPPEPPFVAVMSTAGTKNLVYRGKLGNDRELFPLRVEEDLVWVDRGQLAAVLADFERAYAAGLSKDSILSGVYSTSAVLKVGRALWHRLEAPLSNHRATRLPLMRLAWLISEKPTQEGALDAA